MNEGQANLSLLFNYPQV